jgi:glycerol-3-phosphate acyltransferase PlsY
MQLTLHTSWIFGLIALVAYLLGSLPWGYWLALWFKGIDITQHGSGNTGATNVLRVCGKPLGIATYVLDFLKGFLPVFIFTQTHPHNPWIHLMAGLFIMLGHTRSLFLGFKGGKAAMSGLGIILAVSPLGGLWCALLVGLVIKLTKTVSIGAIVGSALAWLLVWLAGAPLPYVCFTAVAGLFIIMKHKSNIQRLLSGTENSF